MRVLFLDLDTLRPDHLGCYGYHRRTSPNIDRIAADGVRFERYYCPNAPCLPSRAAMVSGRFGIHTGVVGHGGTAADMRLAGQEREFLDFAMDRHSLFALFAHAGYYTASVSPFAERHSAWWFYAGLKEIHNPGQRGIESAEHITPTAVKWLEEHAAGDNWFLHVNYWDPHTPYRAPAEFGNPFADDPLPAWLTDEVVASHQDVVGPHSAREIDMYTDAENPHFPRQPGAARDLAGVRRMIDGYDCGIAYMDGHIGRLLAILERHGVLEDTMIIVTSDHGENLGEMGIYAEHGTADEITCRIPMIVKLPGGQRGHVDRGLHYNLDLVPTIAELFNRPTHEKWDGQSYLASLTHGRDTGREFLVLSQCAHVLQNAVRWDNWIYIRTVHDGYRLLPDELLFNLADDPHEQHDLAPARPDLCGLASRMFQTWHEQMMRTQLPGAPDPMWTVYHEGGPYHTRGHLRSYCDRLKSTGRAAAAEQLLEKHREELA